MIKPVSKYISLARLKELKQNNCMDSTNKVEFNELELDDEILNRSENIAKRLEAGANRRMSTKIGPNAFVDPIELLKADIRLKIDQIVEDEGIDYAKLARRIGISRQALSNIRTGKTAPSFKVIMRLCEQFGLKLRLG